MGKPSPASFRLFSSNSSQRRILDTTGVDITEQEMQETINLSQPSNKDKDGDTKEKKEDEEEGIIDEAEFEAKLSQERDEDELLTPELKKEKEEREAEEAKLKEEKEREKEKWEKMDVQTRIKYLKRKSDHYMRENDMARAQFMLETLHPLLLSTGTPPYSPIALDTLSALAFARHSLSESHSAKGSYTTLLSHMEGHYKAGMGVYPNIGEVLLNYADLLGSLGESEAAEKNCRKAIKMIEKKYGKKSEAHAGAMLNLSSYLGIQKKFDEALTLSKEALGLLKKIYGKDAQETKEALQNTLRLLTDMGRPSEADSLKEEWGMQAPPKVLYEDLDFSGVGGPPPEAIAELRKEWQANPPEIGVDRKTRRKDKDDLLSEMDRFFSSWTKDGLPLDSQKLSGLSSEISQLIGQRPEMGSEDMPFPENTSFDDSSFEDYADVEKMLDEMDKVPEKK